MATNKLYTSDATTNAYESAMADLGSKLATTPTYDSTYDTQLSDLYNKITSRDAFSYSASDDDMYQEYLNRYQQQGKLAMRDTIGQASALTGGYGNTYAQSVGQQTYDAYLTEANEALPDYYNMALSAYNAESDRLNQQYSMLGDLRDNAYGQYRDAMSDYYSNLSLAQQYEAEQYERARYADETEYSRAQDEYQKQIYDSETAYSKQQTAYSQLSSLISSSGYTPSDDELAAAGMSRAQATALAAEYQRQVALANEELELQKYSTYNSGGTQYVTVADLDDYNKTTGSYTISSSDLATAYSSGATTQQLYTWIDNSSDSESKKKALKTDVGAMANSAWRNR